MATTPGGTGAQVRFTSTAEVPGDPAQTRVSGVVLDNTNDPVEGVTVSIVETGQFVQTTAQGRFSLAPAPVGVMHLHVDGTTAARPGSWASLEFQMVTIPGRDNTLGMPVFILPLDWPNGILVSETEGGTIEIPNMPGFSLEVAPGSATFPDGSREGNVSVTVVHADKLPMIPNFGQQPRLVLTVQPPGVLFDPPARVTYPNLDATDPGGTVELYSFDHDMGRFVTSGTATVDEDGLTLTADAGSGIRKGGWTCAGSAAPPPSGTCQPLSVTLSAPSVFEADTEFLITATGMPFDNILYTNWTVVDDPDDDADDPDVLAFVNQPTCPSSTTCEATAKGKKPGTATVEVEVEDTASGNKSRSSRRKIKVDAKIILKEMTYSGAGFHAILQDTGESYPEEHWLDEDENGDADGPDDHKVPVAYILGSGLTVKPTFKLSKTITAEKIQLRGTGIGDLDGFEWAAVLENFTGDILSFPAVASSAGSLPNEVAFVKRARIEWELSFSPDAPNLEKTFQKAGSSDNRIYVILKDPVPSTWRQETLFDFSTRAAQGVDDDAMVIERVWAEIADRTVRRKDRDGFNESDGKRLRYRSDDPAVNDSLSDSCQGLEGMLNPFAGGSGSEEIGTCAAWARFFKAALEVQGVPGGTIVNITPDTTVTPGANGFLVKKWRFIDEHIRTGPDGILRSVAAAGDLAVCVTGGGLPNEPCVSSTDPSSGPPAATPASGDMLDGITNIITTGPDGICQTAAVPGSDTELLPVGQGTPDAPCISAGSDGILDSTVVFPDVLGTGGSLSGEPFPFRIGFDAIDLPGLPGQGVSNRPGVFLNHVVVRLGGQIYDPSYGSGPHLTNAVHENASVDGIAGSSDVAKKKGPTTELTYVP